MKLLARILRAFLAMSPGVAIRAMRFGPRDAAHRLRASYGVVNPLEGWEATAPDPLLPSIPLDDLLGTSRRPTVTLAPDHVAEDGSLAPWEILSLLMLARNRRPTSVLEIGTYFGATTYNLALNLPEAIIHTVDLPPSTQVSGTGTPARTASDLDPTTTQLRGDDFHLIQRRKLGEAFVGSPLAGRIVQHLGDTANIDLSGAMGVEFCFIDGSHTYEYARNDTLRAVSLMEGPGLLIWHDCSPNHPGVMRWLRELAEKGLTIHRVSGTTLAVCELDPDSPLGKQLRAHAPPIEGRG